MTLRREFTPAQKRAALERAAGPDGQPRCQDPLCGVSDEWRALSAELFMVGIRGWFNLLGPMGLSQSELITLRDMILHARFTHRRALQPIIKRFKLHGGALLEVDHDTECADGGDATPDNATVRCVFCHAFKTEDRRAHRAKRPDKASREGAKARKEGPEQLDLVHRARVEGVRLMMQGKIKTFADLPPEDLRAIADGMTAAGERGRKQMERERRHTSEAEFAAAVQRKQRAAEDWPWGA